MNPIRRLTAVVAFCFSMIGLAAPPPPSTFTVTPLKATEYPLSCNGLSKPIVARAWDMLFNSRVDEARQEFKLAVTALKKFVELSRQHTPYLLRKAQRIEEYLNQR